MKSPEDSPIDHSFAEFAWIIRNWARPLGLRNLGCPVQLMGTGMIFPWELIRVAPLESGHLVEDLKLGLDLAAIGKAPLFFPFVIGSSEFPMSVKGTNSQRQRWIQGHVAMMFRTAPLLLVRAIARGNIDLLVLTLDLVVPPLSLLGLLVVGTLGVSSVAALAGGSVAPPLLSVANLVMFVLAPLFAWLEVGKGILPARTMSTQLPFLAQR
ncbi:glycosyltransferase family 2 protein, partial [Nostoc sp. NIES-2111]